MFRSFVCFWARLGGLASWLFAGSVFVWANPPAIEVEGLVDRTIYNNEVAFRVLLLDGFDYEITLDEQPAAGGEWLAAEVGFHTLSIRRVHLVSEEVAARVYQFVVRDPARGDTEWGLFTWTPRPPIPSAPSAFGQVRLRIVAPRHLPRGYPVPVIVYGEDQTGRRLPVNGMVSLSGSSSVAIRMKRGVGHGFVDADGFLSTTFQWRVHGAVGTHEFRRLDAVPRVHVGDVTGSVVWPAGSWVRVRNNFRVSEGASLTIDAGAVVTLDPGVTIEVAGALRIHGAPDRPTVLMASDPLQPWGGIVLWGAPAEVVCAGALFTGSGGDATWFIRNAVRGTHRQEQATVYLGSGARGEFSDCYWIDNAGQAFHGENASLTLERCLVQKAQTVGQFNGGSVEINDSALLDFPNDDSLFVDGDNDAIYFTDGNHVLRRTLVGWCKDDGVDAGGNSPGMVTVEGCWFEACFHEGMALSGTEKLVTVTDTVFLNNQQGLEAGYLSPRATVTTTLFAANQVGIRFGDNYHATHNGSIDVRRSISIFNHRDLWAMVREAWIEKVENVMLDDHTFLSQPAGSFPQAILWDAQADPTVLTGFRGLSVETPVGVGWMLGNWIHNPAAPARTLEVGLSFPAPYRVEVDYRAMGGTAVAGEDFELAAGQLQFDPGESVLPVPLRILDNPSRVRPRLLRMELVPGEHAEAATANAVLFVTLPGAEAIEGDADEDGLPDAWEQVVADADLDDSYFLPTDIEPGGDVDRDGVTNRGEWIADTDAADARSVLRLAVDRLDADQVVFRFEGRAGRSYALEVLDPIEAAWRELAQWPAQEVGREVQWNDFVSSGGGIRYYRIAAQWPGE